MFASLPMYDRPELTRAHGAYWALIRTSLEKRGIDAPKQLTPNGLGIAFWTDPTLVLSQTCGYPYRTSLKDKVTLVGTPDYGVTGCPPGYYRSCFVVRAGDARADLAAFGDARFAFNELGSQSGFVAAQTEAARYGFQLDNRVETGAHRRSAAAVANGQADIACLDAVTWRFIQMYDDVADQLDVLTMTSPTPGLPYICALSIDGAAVFSAVNEALSALPVEHKNALMIKRIVPLQPADYPSLDQEAGVG
ncbi:phosphate/phosphite/phosphonate ABC transporter substrate-binding protein [Sulfitobacter sp.]|uniref:phosphate/phosphite/phosphonate ABC transporter substrate-binding protein n=1 Tax=Sulfitobacter sp. TaxID=1903071 RepID=UPI0035622EE7